MTTSIPLWVPAILVVLLTLGYRQSTTRVVRPATVVTVASAMFAFSLWGVASAFGAVPMALLAWAAGYATSVLAAGTRLAPQDMAREGERVRVPGSWLPLALMLGIFAAKFVLGFARGVGAHVLEEAWFIAGTSAMLGALSGGFAARAVAVHRFASASSGMA